MTVPRCWPGNEGRALRSSQELRHQQPHTPPWLEQHPCLLAQFVQLGEIVPSQQRNEPPGWGVGVGVGVGVTDVTEIVAERWIGPQMGCVADRVSTSFPDLEATYDTGKEPTFEPEAGERLLPSDEESDQEVAFPTESVRFPPVPCLIVAGATREAVAAGTIVRTVTASLPAPHAVLARPEYRMLAVEPTAVLPELGSEDPIPSIRTEASGSDAFHVKVVVTPGQALPDESMRVSVGDAHAARPEPGAAARRLPALATGGIGSVVGEKLIDVTGFSSIPLGAEPVWPSRKLKNPMPRTSTGIATVRKLPEGAATLSSNAA